jgi:hypothetical protein
MEFPAAEEEMVAYADSFLFGTARGFDRFN